MNEKHDISKIKDAFNAPSLQAPDDLWSGISEGLDNASLDGEVSGAFTEAAQTAPPDLWDGIARELVVDTTWKRILGQMRRTVIVERLVQKVLMIVALLIGHTLNEYVSNVGDLVYDQTEMSDPTIHELSDAPFGVLNDDVVPSSAGPVLPEVPAPIEYTPFPIPTEYPSSETPQFIPRHFERVFATTVKLGQLSYDVIDLWMPKHEMIGPVNFFLPRSTNFRLTAYGALNNPSVINNAKRIGERSGSLIETELTFNVNYGFTLEYDLNPSTALLADVNLFKVIDQHYNEFTDGKYVENQRLMLYDQYGLGATYRFNRYHERFGTALNGGFYLSKLRLAKAGVGEDLVNITSEIRSWDQGIWIGVAEEYRLKRATLSLGFRSQWGIRNIHVGNDIVPAEFDHTLTRNNMLNLGVQVPLRF